MTPDKVEAALGVLRWYCGCSNTASEALSVLTEALAERERVKELPELWRGFERANDRRIQDAHDCADDLEAAMKGGSHDR